MVRVVDCHAGVLGSNPGGPKDFSLWNYFNGVRSNSVTPGQSDKKKALFFLVLSLFYRSQMVNFKISKKSTIFQGSRGGLTFSRGVQLFPGEV